MTSPVSSFEQKKKWCQQCVEKTRELTNALGRSLTSLVLDPQVRPKPLATISDTSPKPTPKLTPKLTPKAKPIPSIKKEDCLTELIEGSGIDREIAELNFKVLEGNSPWEHLFYSDKIERTNTRRLSSYWLNSYSHIENGGWWASGVDPITGEDSPWGCFKPVTPRRNKNKEGKTIKYEHPPKAPTGAFFLRIPMRLWEAIAQRYNVPILFTDIDNNREDLGFWEWVKNHPEIEIIPTEGVKKAAAILSLGFVAIGFPGIWGAYRKNDGNSSLMPQLLPFAEGGRYFSFAFDQDEKRKTRRANKNALGRTARLLTKKHNCQVKIIEWDPLYKGADDLIVKLGIDAFINAYKKALPYQDWISNSYWELTYAPDLILDKLSKYIGDFDPPSSAKLICLKAPKGSGKTEWLIRLVREAMQRGQRILVITHREQLGKTLSDRFGIQYLSELGIHDVQGIFGFALCFDSLRMTSRAQFNPDDWKGCLVILDECEQSIWHLLNARTEVSKHRVEVLRNFQQVIQGALNSEHGKVCLSDADLSDVSVSYIRSLAGFDIKPWVAVKEGIPNPWKAIIWEKPEELLAVVKLTLKLGGTPLIFVDGQKEKSLWGTTNLEAELKRTFPDKRFLRVDAKSTSDPNHPAYKCLSNFDESVQSAAIDKEVVVGYDAVICSPTIETGISIDLKRYFTLVADFSQGVIPTHSVLQRLDRLRESIPRHIYAAPYGALGKIGNGSFSPKTLIDGLKSKAAANFKLLQSSEYDFDSALDFQPKSTKTWAIMAARINLGMYQYRNTIVRNLLREGHEVEMGNYADFSQERDDSEPTRTDIIKQIRKELKETRDEQYQEYCEAVIASPTPTFDQLQKLQSKRELTKDEQLQRTKGELVERYDNDLVSPKLVKIDDEGEYPKAQRHYHLFQGMKFLKDRDRRVIDKNLESGEGKLFLPDISRKLIGATIAVLDWLEIPQLFHQKEIGDDGAVKDKRWSNEDPILIGILEKCRKNPQLIKNFLGIKVGDNDTPISLTKRILKQSLGLSFGKAKRVGGREKQLRLYGPVQISELRMKILDVWFKRDLEERKREQEALLQSQVSESEAQQAIEYQETHTKQREDIATINTRAYQIESQEVDVPQIPLAKELTETFEFCETPEDFQNIISGVDPQVVDDAITLYWVDPYKERGWDVPTRYQLREWQKMIKNPVEPVAGQTFKRWNSFLGKFTRHTIKKIENGCVEFLDGCCEYVKDLLDFQKYQPE